MWEAEPEDHVDLMSDSLPRKAEKGSTGMLETREPQRVWGQAQESSGSSGPRDPRKHPVRPHLRTQAVP